MEYVLPQGKHTPFIKISGKKGVIEIKGSSNSDNSFKFYEEIINKVRNYESDKSNIVVNVMMEYFNTSSAKCIFDVFKSVAELSNKGFKAEVNWYYNLDDEDMRLTGEDYSDLCGMPFNFIEIV